MHRVIKEIQGYRFTICKAFLITIAIIAVPALSASLIRIRDIGWRPVMGIHIFIAVVLWSFAFLRNRIPYVYQAGFIVFMFLAIGVGGLYQFGLIAGGIVFLTAAAPIATIFFEWRTGIAILVFSLLCAALFGVFTVSGGLLHDFDIASYALAPSSWLTSVFGWALTSTALTVSLHVFNGKLIKALIISQERADELNEQKLILQQTIAEKEKALTEIRTLQGIIPICSYCHRIRSDEGAWSRLEAYISKHSEAKFSHSICPECEVRARKDLGLEAE